MTYDEWRDRTGDMPMAVYRALAAAGLAEVPQPLITCSLYDRAMRGEPIPPRELPRVPQGPRWATRPNRKPPENHRARMERIARDMRRWNLTHAKGRPRKAAAIGGENVPKLLFRGTFIRFVDVRYDEKSKTVYTKINLTADFSEPIREALEWGEPPEGFASADLDGELIASHIILTPNGELKPQEIQLDAREIGNFKLVRVNDDQEGATHNELRFQVTTAAPDAAALLAAYLSVVGKGEAQLRVNYEQQGELDTAPDAQERLISEEQPADTADEGATLAPAALVGGTHQRGRKRQSTETLN